MNAPKINSLSKQKMSKAKAVVINSLNVAELKVVEEVLSTSTIKTVVLVRTCKRN